MIPHFPLFKKSHQNRVFVYYSVAMNICICAIYFQYLSKDKLSIELESTPLKDREKGLPELKVH